MSGRVLVAGAGPDHPLAGVTLRLSDPSGRGTSLSAHTDASGRFAFTGLEPRGYGLSVETSGFHPYRRQVEVRPGEAKDLEISLEPAFSGAVTVTATRSERRTEEVPAAVTVVGREELDQTPMTNLARTPSRVCPGPT